MGFIDTVQSILSLKQRYSQIGPVYIEDKANGSAIIEVLKTKIPGIIPVQPNGGKEARVHSITPYLEAGNVLLPKHAPFTEKLVEECLSFPRGANDDGVDAMTYAIDKLLVNGSSNYAALAGALLF
jgi:predicted phage terminase large subunit-like protein